MMQDTDTRTHLIDGTWQNSADGVVIDVVNPSTGAVFTQLARGREAEIDRAVAAARRAFEQGWRATRRPSAGVSSCGSLG